MELRHLRWFVAISHDRFAILWFHGGGFAVEVTSM